MLRTNGLTKAGISIWKHLLILLRMRVRTICSATVWAYCLDNVWHGHNAWHGKPNGDSLHPYLATAYRLICSRDAVLGCALRATCDVRPSREYHRHVQVPISR